LPKSAGFPQYNDVRPVHIYKGMIMTDFTDRMAIMEKHLVIRQGVVCRSSQHNQDVKDGIDDCTHTHYRVLCNTSSDIRSSATAASCEQEGAKYAFGHYPFCKLRDVVKLLLGAANSGVRVRSSKRTPLP
jgi:hypothetical protein